MSKTRSNLVISHMNQEERRHWASWIGMIAEGVAGVMAVNLSLIHISEPTRH